MANSAATAPSLPPVDLSKLPSDVVATILAHVPAKERLSSCALVCQSWAAVCARASTTLTVRLHSQAQAEHLTAWLGQHGPNVQHLHVSIDHAAHEEAVLQWQQLHKRRRLDGGSQVQGRANTTPSTITELVTQLTGELYGRSDWASSPQQPRIKLALPFQWLQDLRLLRLEDVHLTQQRQQMDSVAAPTTTSTTTTTTSSVAGSRPDPPAGSQQPTLLPRLVHLHVDERTLGGLVQLLLPRKGGTAAAAAASSAASASAAASAAAPAAAPAASFASNLETLKITTALDNSCQAMTVPDRAAINAAFTELSASCEGLQRLLLSTPCLDPAALTHLPGLRQLQHVQLQVPTHGFSRRPMDLSAWLQQLPAQQLTSLVLSRRGNDKARLLDLSPASIGQLSCCVCLQHLSISCGTAFEPSVLAPLTSLTHLQLSAVELKAGVPAAGAEGAAAAAGAAQVGSAAMLAVLPCLVQLRVLQLSPELLPTPHAPLEHYSALTASSHLTLLSLYDCQLPAGAAAFMFPPGRLLPALGSLRMPQPLASQRPCSAEALNKPTPFLSDGAAAALRAARHNSNTTNTSGGSGDSSSSRPGPPFGAGSIASLAAACPNLRQLWLTAAVAAAADLAPLLQLSALSELQLGGCVVDDAAAEAVLCELRQLQRLDLVQCPGFTDAGLAYLTALTALTSLQVRECGLSHCTAALGQTLYMCKRQEGTVGTPVCERLRQQCTNSRECLLVMLKQRDTQLAAATAALEAAQAQAAGGSDTTV